MKTYIFHNDPGHGWLAVKRTELERLSILDKVSLYSYQKGGTVYLEEDCDARLFIEAKMQFNENYDVRNSYQEHTPIRNFSNFSLDKQNLI